MQSINLNLVPGSFQQVFNCSQGDIGRQLTAKLFDGSTEYAIPVGSTVKIKATKPSGFGFDESATFSGSTVTITTAETMTNEWGRFPAELVITKDGNVIGTANFLFNIEKNPHPDSTVDGDAEEVIPELTLLVERVEAAASSVLDMEVVATTLPAGSQASYSYDEDLNKATFGIPQGEAGAGAAGVVASAYSSSKTYKVGDYVLHNSNLYRCITAITTAEAFTAAHWTQIVLADDVSDLKTDFNKLTSEGYISTPYTVTLNKGFNRDDGTFPDENNWDITSFIPVVGGSVIYIDNPIATTNYNGWYRADKSYIKAFYVVAGTGLAFRVPVDASYMVLTNNHARFSFTVWQKPTGIATVTDKNAINNDIDGILNEIYKVTDNWIDFEYNFDLWKQGSPAADEVYTIFFDKPFSVTTGQNVYGSVPVTPNFTNNLYMYVYAFNGDTFVSYNRIGGNGVNLNPYTVPSGVDTVYIALTTNSVSVPITPTSVKNIGVEMYAGLSNVKIDAIYSKYQDKHAVPATWQSSVPVLQTDIKNQFVFGVQSDTHYYAGLDDTGKNLAELSNYVGFDFICNLGDIIHGYNEDGKDNIDLVRKDMSDLAYDYTHRAKCPVMFAFGNHDDNPMWAVAHTSDGYIKIDEAYGRLYSFGRNTMPCSVWHDRNVYYYNDFGDIRVIVLNTTDTTYTDGSSTMATRYAISDEQLAWFTNVALDTDKAIIVMCHCPIDSTLAVDGASGGTNYAEALATIDAFKNNGGTVIGCFYGHNHAQNDTMHNGFPEVMFANGGSFCEVVTVDLETKTVTAKVVGNSSLTQTRTWNYS